MLENTTLSSRETEILVLVAQGKTNKEIASLLYISLNTVKVHVSNIFQKIGVSSRTEATLYAIEQGIVQSLAAPVIPVNSDIPTLLNNEIFNETPKQPTWVKKYWWILLFFLLSFFAILQVTLPSLFLSTTSQTPDSFIEALNQNRMESISQMNTPRIEFASAINDNKIYVIGGATESMILNTTERYDIVNNSWKAYPQNRRLYQK